jgi:lipopolysaccharide/colanic/teichoic acid biosynthesis glycosyltransferase
VLAFVLTILSSPLLLLAAALLKLSSRAPLLARQRCVGLGGQPFDL